MTTIDPLALTRDAYIAARLRAAFPPDRVAYSSAIGGTGRRYRPRTDLDPFLDRAARERVRAGRDWDRAHRAPRPPRTRPAPPRRMVEAAYPALVDALAARPEPPTWAGELDLAGWLAREEAALAALERRAAREPDNAALAAWTATTRAYVALLRREVGTA